MGREVRRVPPDWEHPDQENGRGLQPLYDESFDEAARRWKEQFLAWEDGHNATFDRPRDGTDTEEFWEYNGQPPERAYYRPDWPEETRTHYQMYETVTEGTPISPVMPSPEPLARWLADHNANAGAGAHANYEAWLRVCLGGYAPSMVMIGGQLMDGVSGLTDSQPETSP